MLHNYYQDAGGEDTVFAMESALLTKQGHEVTVIAADNSEISSVGRLRVAAKAVWAPDWHRLVAELLTRESFDVAHVHNFFPLISPSVYFAFNNARVPVVQTLHNYRLLCPAGTLLRSGSPCHDCVGKSYPWPGVLHACYRESHLASAATATMLGAHNLLRTWSRRVDQYIALTDFAKNMFVRGGLPETKISVKPNFVHPDPTVRSGFETRGGALFVGRLSSEKGLSTLVDSWSRLGGIGTLTIVGQGPERTALEDRVQQAQLAGVITFRGAVEHKELLNMMSRAKFLVLPSECYEGFPLVLAEAFASGTPVIASRLGAMAEIIDDGQTGLLFEPGDAQDLEAKIRIALQDSSLLREMSSRCRTQFETKYTAARNYDRLIEIYVRAKEEEASVKRRD